MGMVGTVYALFTADTTSFTRKMKALGVSAGTLGKTLTMKLTAPLLLIAGAAVKVSADFEQKLTNAFSVTGSASEEVKGQMEDLARAMGKDTVFSAGEAADAMYYMACLKPDEYIITDDYRVEKIGSYKGNSVIGKNGVSQKVLKHTYRPCTEGEVLKIKPGLQLPFSVTANHPILAIKTKPCRPHQEAGKSNSPKLCKPNCSSYLRENCTKVYYEDYRPEWIEAGKLKPGYALLIPRIKKSEEIQIDWNGLGINADFYKTRYGKNLHERLDEDLAYFLGLMMGDGWVDKERISCVFNAEKDIKSKIWFIDYLKKHGYSTNERKTPGAIQVTAWSRPLAKLISKWIGKGAENKHIPKAIFQAEEKIINSFLRGYITADGYVDYENSIIGLSTISPHIAYTINYLLAKIGIVFSIGKTNGKTKMMPSGSVSDCKDLFSISTTNPDYIEKIFGIRPKKELKYQKHWIDDDYIYLPIRSIEKEKYGGFVYNLETKDNTYSTGVIVHNSAGWKVEQMSVALEDTLNLAAATQEDLAFTTNTVVSALNMFGKSASEAGAVADIYANAISNSQATLNKLGTSMSYVGPIANSLGYSIEDTTAALMGLYNKGIDASMAGTGLRMSLMKLLKPTGSAKKALKEMGLTIEDLNPQTNSLTDIVRKLEAANMDAKQAVEIFGARASAAMINLVATGGDALDGFKDKLGESGTSARMAAQQIDTLKGQWKLLTSALSEVAIQFGKILIPLLKDLINKHLKPFVQWLGSLNAGTKKWIVAIAILAAALGPLGLLFSKLTIAAGALGKAFTFLAAHPIVATIAVLLVSIPKLIKGINALSKSYKDWQEITKGSVVSLEEIISAVEKNDKAFAQWSAALMVNGNDMALVMKKLENGTLKGADAVQQLYDELKAAAKVTEEATKKESELNKIIAAATKGKHALTYSYRLLAGGVNAYCDNLIYEAKLKGNLTEKRKAEIEKIRSELTNMDLLFKAHNKITAALKDRTNLTPKLISQLEKRKEALEKLIGPEKTHLKLTKELIPKIKDERTEIEKLNDEYWDLMARVFKGEAGWQSLIEQAGIIKGKISALKDEFSDLDMAIDDDAEEWIDLGDKVNTVLEDMGYGLGSIPDKVDDVGGKIKTGWGEMADGLQTKWASTISGILTKTGDLKEKLNSMFGAIKTQFADMAGEALSKWMTTTAGMKAAAIAFAAYVTVNLVSHILKAFGIIKENWDDIWDELEKAREIPDTEKGTKRRLEDMVNDTNEWTAAIDELNKHFNLFNKTGEMTFEGQKLLNDAWAEAISLAKKYGQEGTKAFVDMIKKMREMGLESEVLSDYIWEQSSAIPDALSIMINNIPDFQRIKDRIAKKKLRLEDIVDPDLRTELIKEIDVLEERLARGTEWAGKSLNNTSKIVAASWQAMIAEGKGYMEVLDAMKEPLEALRQRYKDLGQDVPEFLAPMFDVLEKMEVAPKVFENLDASRAILESLTNSAYLTQDAFNALSKSAASFARTMLGVTGNLNDFMNSAELTTNQVQQLLPVVSQFVGAAAVFGMKIPAWMKTFVGKQLGIEDFSEFKKTAAAQANAGVETVKKLDRVDQRIKRQTERMVSKFDQLGDKFYKHLGTVMGRVTNRLDKIHNSLSKIGSFATGGIAWTPQLATLAENGPEVILSKSDYDQKIAQPSNMNMMIEIQPIVIPSNEGHIIKFLQKSIKRGNFKIPISAVGD